METFLIVLAFVCMAVGIIGCVMPGLPGTPIAYAGLWVAHATDQIGFSWQTLLIWGIVTVVVSILDYVVPAWGTKRYGGTKYGVWGSIIGVFVGLLGGFGGVIFGPLIGAFVGELIGGKSTADALRAGWGSFIGILFGTLIKLICCGWMTLILIRAMW